MVLLGEQGQVGGRPYPAPTFPAPTTSRSGPTPRSCRRPDGLQGSGVTLKRGPGYRVVPRPPGVASQAVRSGASVKSRRASPRVARSAPSRVSRCLSVFIAKPGRCPPGSRYPKPTAMPIRRRMAASSGPSLRDRVGLTRSRDVVAI